MFGHEINEAIKLDAIKRFPIESCGLVLARDDGSVFYKPVDNMSSDPENSFQIDDQLILALSPSIRAIVHSHPNGPNCPSQTDMEQQIAFALPFGIVSTDGVGCLEPFFWGDQVPKMDLIGRPFQHGVTDCYALCRDFYATLGIKLNEHPREWEWWLNGGSLYEDFLAKEGFRRIDESEVRENDGFLAQIRSPTPNHAGVYVGDGLILHHLSSRDPWDPSRISRREPVGGWSKFICGFWVRHESLF